MHKKHIDMLNRNCFRVTLVADDKVKGGLLLDRMVLGVGWSHTGRLVRFSVEGRLSLFYQTLENYYELDVGARQFLIILRQLHCSTGYWWVIRFLYHHSPELRQLIFLLTNNPDWCHLMPWEGHQLSNCQDRWQDSLTVYSINIIFYSRSWI